MINLGGGGVRLLQLRSAKKFRKTEVYSSVT